MDVYTHTHTRLPPTVLYTNGFPGHHIVHTHMRRSQSTAYYEHVTDEKLGVKLYVQTRLDTAGFPDPTLPGSCSSFVCVTSPYRVLHDCRLCIQSIYVDLCPLVVFL